MNVLIPSCGGLLNLDVTKRYLRPKKSYFDVPENLFMDLRTLMFKVAFVTQVELVGTLLDVELLLRTCYDLVLM